VVTPQGPGKVIQQNVLYRKIRVALDEGKEVEFDSNEVREESFFDRYRKRK
jgi:hypothetical protein